MKHMMPGMPPAGMKMPKLTTKPKGKKKKKSGMKGMGM